MLSRIEKYGVLNTHDLVKVMAVLFMTIDHVGAYMMPGELWLRALGRFAFPMFFLLVGYGRSTRIGQELWWGAWILLLVQIATYYPIFPLNALVSVMVCRWALRLDDRYRLAERFPLESVAVLFFFNFFCQLFWEYGGMAVMFAFAGRMVQRGYRDRRHIAFWVVTVVTYLLWQDASFAFTPLQLGVVVVGVIAVCVWFYQYEQREFALRLPRAADFSLKLLSRYSLQYYVLHRAVFQLVGAYVLQNHAHVGRLFDL